MNKKHSNSAGFLTVISLFLIISLASVGAMAISATNGGERLTQRTGEYAQLYSAACEKNEKTLAQVDSCICEAAASGLFDMNFEALISELDGVSWSVENGVYTVDITTPIDSRTAVNTRIKADAVFTGSKGIRTAPVRKTIITDDADDDEHLNVWQG